MGKISKLKSSYYLNLNTSNIITICWTNKPSRNWTIKIVNLLFSELSWDVFSYKMFLFS